MVEARDQVFRTYFSPVLFISVTRFSSSGATNGPFLILLLMFPFPPYFAFLCFTMNFSVRALVDRVL